MTIREAVESGDLDRLVRLVDGLCASRDWDGVVELRDRCRHALERGLQLWPAAEFAEYRMALEAPPEYAGPVVVEGAGRFALGPLWEVAASTHGWSELAEHLSPGPARALLAHERVMRGEDLSEDPSIDRNVLDLPLRLMDWEPRYGLAEYRSNEADFPTPDRPRLRTLDATNAGERIDDPESLEALLALASVWAEQSNGEVAAVAVEGPAESAIAAVDDGPVIGAEISASQAIAAMAWTGASGGAYGRRRGSPMGRFGAWWAAASLAGVEWPPDPDGLAAEAAALRWLVWEPAESAPGWSGCIAAESAGEGIAWALLAIDSHREEDAVERR
ncbi:MAG TPA: hypothetical protein VK960_08865 [Acidimicrobiia bacterium]|nr:hypothetical protein [Acidimicrobiia bacterium]